MDNLVLDLEKYCDFHPGGKFVLTHNFGKDISKFFYGGYVLEENLSGKSPKGHTHSNVALKVVNKIAIATFEGASSKPTVCKVI